MFVLFKHQFLMQKILLRSAVRQIVKAKLLGRQILKCSKKTKTFIALSFQDFLFMDENVQTTSHDFSHDFCLASWDY